MLKDKIEEGEVGLPKRKWRICQDNKRQEVGVKRGSGRDRSEGKKLQSN